MVIFCQYKRAKIKTFRIISKKLADSKKAEIRAKKKLGEHQKNTE